MSPETNIAGFLLKKHDPSPAQRKAGQDRYGFTLEERVTEQRAQLQKLKMVLTPDCYKRLESWCLKQNKPADPNEAWPGGVHRVPMGTELLQWLFRRGELLMEQEQG